LSALTAAKGLLTFHFYQDKSCGQPSVYPRFRFKVHCPYEGPANCIKSSAALSSLGNKKLKWLGSIAAYLFILIALSSSTFAQNAKPEQVTFGLYINDIQQLDLKAQNYAMDFYIWLRWNNPAIDPSKSLEFMNTFNRSDHVITPLYEEPQKMPDGSLYMATRVRGQFATVMPLETYPFDVQHLKIIFEDSGFGIGKQIYVPDQVPVLLSPRLSLAGYVIDKAEFARSNILYPTNFGDLRTKELESYSRVTVSVPIHRNTLSNAIKVILPIFLVAVCAALVFFIHPIYVEGRIGMGITALLTLVALQITSNSQLPETDYLMMVDKLFFAAYVFVILSLAQAVRASWPMFHNNTARAIRQDRIAFVVLFGAFTLGVIFIMYSSLSS
jgi:hypothetical protein